MALSFLCFRLMPVRLREASWRQRTGSQCRSVSDQAGSGPRGRCSQTRLPLRNAARGGRDDAQLRAVARLDH